MITLLDAWSDRLELLRICVPSRLAARRLHKLKKTETLRYRLFEAYSDNDDFHPARLDARTLRLTATKGYNQSVCHWHTGSKVRRFR